MKNKGYGKFIDLVVDGREGNNIWLPLPFRTLSPYMSIAKRRYYLIAGDPGSGKSSFATSVFGLLPYIYWKRLKDRDETDINLKIRIRSMERNQIFLYAKWASLYLLINHNILTDTRYLLSEGVDKESRLPDDVFKLIVEAKDFFNEMSDHVQVVDGTITPSDMKRDIKAFALNYGKLVESEDPLSNHLEYEENNSNNLLIYMVDHLGRGTREPATTQKDTVDEISKVLANSRDNFGIISAATQQFNRNIGDTRRRLNNNSVKPESRDLKDSGNPFEDCDTCFGIYDPYRYSMDEYLGYKLKQFVNSEKFCRFRAISLMKNTYGPSDIITGSNFIGECGLYKSLPVPSNMSPELYTISRELEANIRKLK